MEDKNLQITQANFTQIINYLRANGVNDVSIVRMFYLAFADAISMQSTPPVTNEAAK